MYFLFTFTFFSRCNASKTLAFSHSDSKCDEDCVSSIFILLALTTCRKMKMKMRMVWNWVDGQIGPISFLYFRRLLIIADFIFHSPTLFLASTVVFNESASHNLANMKGVLTFIPSCSLICYCTLSGVSESEREREGKRQP